jgi:hypothetical protein
MYEPGLVHESSAMYIPFAAAWNGWLSVVLLVFGPGVGPVPFTEGANWTVSTVLMRRQTGDVGYLQLSLRFYF